MADRYDLDYSEINWYETGNKTSVGKWTKQKAPSPPIHCPDISGTWVVDSGPGDPGTMVQMAQHDHDNNCYLTATSEGAIWSPAQGSFLEGRPENRFGMGFYTGRGGSIAYIGMASPDAITWFETGFDKPVGNWTKQVDVETAVEPL
jgi:hypothetical protein